MSNWSRASMEYQAEMRASFARRGFPEELLSVMQMWVNEKDKLQAFVGREYCGGRTTDPLRWHVSVSGQASVPTWEQMAEAAHAIRPGVHFVMMVPPRSLWMNVHPHTLHLWETMDDALVQEARANARGDTPT